jgi:hypothetical protein
MKWNPKHDPFVETGYFGYAVRAIAHRHSAISFVPMLEIIDPARNRQVRLYEGVFNQDFPDPDSAIHYARGKGYQIIDDLLAQIETDDPVEYIS